MSTYKKRRDIGWWKMGMEAERDEGKYLPGDVPWK
jgi:hypothetical protein